MNYLLTGATGYLGHHLGKALLRRGDHVRALVRTGSDLSRLPEGVIPLAVDPGDALSLAQTVGEVDFEVLIHLAALPVARHDAASFDANLEANLLYGCRLLETLRQRGGGIFLSAGSYWQGGDVAHPGPNTLYAAAKAALQEFVAYYQDRHGVRGGCLILQDIYGPADWRGKFLPALAAAMAAGKTIPATEGLQKIDLVHVSDACAAFMRAAELLQADPAAPGPWSVETGRLLTLREVAEIAAGLAGRPVPAAWGSLPTPSHLLAAPRRLAPILPGWSPRISLEEGLAEILWETNLPGTGLNS